MERDTDPVSCPINDVVNFLAELFQKGYQYRSLNSYRSAISSVHEKVDGVEIGQHPLVSRLLKGAFNSRPPQPRYDATWDVKTVTTYLSGMGKNEGLSLQALTQKLVMLFSLTRPARAADLVQLNIAYRKFLPEGVCFTPSGLAKQSRSGKALQELFFPAFPHDLNLCPVQTLRIYEQRTHTLRSSGTLLIGTVKPHKPVTSSTIARWLRTVLEKSGVDISIFKAHSVWGAAATAASRGGITTNEILKAADWSSESVFTKFYYKPTRDVSFGEAVLSTSNQATNNTVDIETEHSDI